MKNNKFSFFAACSGMLVFGMVMVSLGTINTFLISKFSLDSIKVGSLAALLPFGILIGSLIFGPIVDKYGYKTLLIINVLLILIGIECISFTNSFLFIQLSFFLIGFGGGVINGGTNALVSDLSDENKGANISFLGVFYGIGALGMPAITGYLLNYFSFEIIIRSIGLFISLPILFFLLSKLPEPKQPQGLPIKDIKNTLKEIPLFLLGFFLFFQSGLEGIVNNWFTTYLQKIENVSIEHSLYALTTMAICLTVTRLILSKLLLKFKAYIILFIGLGVSIIASIILMISNSFFVSLIGLGLFGVGFAGNFPIILSYVGNLYSKISGTAISIALFIALTGNVLLNYFVGIFSNSFGLNYIPLFIFMLLILMILIFLLIIKNISKKTII